MKMKAKPPRLQGKVVRLVGKRRTAIVLSDTLCFGNGQVSGALYLDRRLGGSRYWNAEHVEVVE